MNKAITTNTTAVLGLWLIGDPCIQQTRQDMDGKRAAMWATSAFRWRKQPMLHKCRNAISSTSKVGHVAAVVQARLDGAP
eukprot:3188278-Amphidinium_carterae.1